MFVCVKSVHNVVSALLFGSGKTTLHYSKSFVQPLHCVTRMILSHVVIC
jgi:hypothetical protein